MTDYLYDSCPTTISYRPFPASSPSSYSPSPASTPSPTIGVPSSRSTPGYESAGYASAHSLQKNYCQDFSCCGLSLADMHDLLDHFEDHAVMLDNDGSPIYPTTSSASSPSSPSDDIADASPVVVYPQSAQPSTYSYPTASHQTAVPQPRDQSAQVAKPYSPANYSYGYSYAQGLGIALLEDEYDPFGFSCNGASSAALGSDSAFPSPLLPPPSSSSSSSGSSVYDYSGAPSPFSPSGSSVGSGSAYSSPSLINSGSMSRPSYSQQRQIYAPQPVHPHAQTVPIPTASLPMIERQTGTLQRSHSASSAHSLMQRRRQTQDPYAIPPSLSRSQPREQPSVSSAHKHDKPASKHKKGVEKSKRIKDGRVKAYRCPQPGCTKAYLNPNGLKYHLEKGTCSIDPSYVPVCNVLPSQSHLQPMRA